MKISFNYELLIFTIHELRKVFRQLDRYNLSKTFALIWGNTSYSINGRLSFTKVIEKSYVFLTIL